MNVICRCQTFYKSQLRAYQYYLFFMTKIKQTFFYACGVFILSLAVWISTYHNQPLSNGRILANYQTSSTRTSTVGQVCAGFSRTQLSAGSGMSQYISTVSSDIGIDGVAIIKQIRDGQDQQTRDQLQNNNAYVTFTVAFLIGFFLLLVFIPFFCCWCACPSTCPVCCRKHRSIPFENSELSWPWIVALIFLLFALITALYGASVVGQTRDAFRKASCSGAILTDDIRNGNVTNDNSSYFMGLNQMPILLEQLRTNLTNIDNNLTQLYSNTSTTTLNQAITQSQTALADTVLISNNDTAGNPLTLTYNTSLDSLITNSSIPSTFPAVLGTSSTSGLVFVLHSAILAFQQFLSTLKSNAQSFHNNLPSFDSGLSTAVSNSTTLRDRVNSGLGNTDQFLSDSKQFDEDYASALLAYWIITVIFIVFGIAATICTKAQNSSCCRKLMYLSGSILIISSIFGFFLSSFYSVSMPIAVWSCQYFNQTISSQQHFQSNLAFAFDSTTLQQAGVCMPFGNGNLFEQVAGTTNANYFNELKNIFSDITTFNLAGFMTPIVDAQNAALTTTDNYAMGRLMDITDSPSLNILSSLATPTIGAVGACLNLASDSWVPSNSQSQQSSFIINCAVSNGNQGTATTCSSGVATTAGGCSGCMDSSQVLFRYVNNFTLLVDLQARYLPTCSFATKLNNVWTNYYQVKLKALGPTVGSTASTSGVYPRIKTVESDVSTLNSTVDPALPSVFSNINSNLASISSVTDPVFGVLGGTNCTLIGEDVQRIQNTFCGQMIDHMYIARIATGIVSYFLFVSICFIICFGNRHARWEEETCGGFGKQDLYIEPMHSNEHFR